MSTEKYEFNVEINNLMNIMIKSVYTDAIIAVRELISNASDALDKKAHQFRDENIDINLLKIAVSIDKENKIMTIADNGIGMSKEDMVNFLGGIARSGTKIFKEMNNYSLQERADALIGRFGLGFYSAFLLANKVDVISRYYGSEETFMWSSSEVSSYTITPVDEVLEGTRVILHMKDEYLDLLEGVKMESTIKKYSGAIAYQIFLHDLNPPKEEKKDDEQKVEEVTEPTEQAEQTEPVQEQTEQVKLINTDKPLWNINPKEITHEQYTAFYKSISNDWEDFSYYVHKRFEGTVRYTLLLFIPKNNRTNLFEKKKHNNIKLYCNNVFVTDNFEGHIPDWCNFVHAVVASPDLDMNISREMLQGKDTYRAIKNIVIREIIKLVKSIPEDKYNEFYEQYSDVLKFAARESDNRDRFMDFLRYDTNMRENVKLADLENLYYITDINKGNIRKNPHLKLYSEKNIEVILMDNPMDEIMLQSVKEYKKKEFKNILTSGSEIFGQSDQQYETLIKRLKEDFKFEKIEVRDLGKYPILFESPKFGFSPSMKKLMESQVGSANNPMLKMMEQMKDTMLLNGNHLLVQKLNDLLENDEQAYQRQAKILIEMGRLMHGTDISDKEGFFDAVLSVLE